METEMTFDILKVEPEYRFETAGFLFRNWKLYFESE